jgi:IclR family acetate operon transcriptional repressor
VRALERVLAILEAVADGNASASLVAERIGLSLSTAARLMRQMTEEGMLERSVSGYALGPRLVTVVQSAYHAPALSEFALPSMRALRDNTDQTVSLHVRRLDERVCIAAVESEQPVRRVVPVGLALPLHFGATGAVLLSALSQADLSEYLNHAQLSPPERSVIEDRIAQASKVGWSAAVEAWSAGLSGIAAAITSGSSVVAALSVSGAAARWTMPIMRSYRARIVSCAADISRHMNPGVRLS